MKRSEAIEAFRGAARSALAKHGIDLHAQGKSPDAIHAACASYATRLATWLNDTIAELDARFPEKLAEERLRSNTLRSSALTKTMQLLDQAVDNDLEETRQYLIDRGTTSEEVEAVLERRRE